MSKYLYKKKYHDYFMKVALDTAELSDATKLKVGVVAVKNRRIVWNGFNGTPEGHPSNVCEGSDGMTLPEVLHAEENMILSAAKEGIVLNGCIAYITHSPCLNCARMLYGVGFKQVWYYTEYRNDAGIKFLQSVNIPVLKYEA